jgi:hypothetical protein
MAGTYLASGDDQVQVSFAHGDYVCPRLVPGQDQLLLNSRRGGRIGIWRQDTKGSRRDRLCDGDQVSVAPDGQSIVFRRDGTIAQRDLSSGAERVLSPRAWVSCSYPSSCPDGRVLFVWTDHGRDELCIADPRGDSPPGLLLEGEIGSAPRPSPDGQLVAYPDGAHLYLFDLRAERRRRLTFAAGVQSWPMWSRDGKSLAYLQSPSPVDGPWHVYRVRLDDPREAALVLRDVEPAPDWNGLGFTEGESSALGGDDVRLWHSPPREPLPPGPELLRQPQGDWRALAAGALLTNEDVRVDCTWGGAYLSAGTGRFWLVEKKGETSARTAEIRPLTGQGQPANRIDSVGVTSLGVDEVRIEATFRCDGGSAKAGLQLSRTRPLVEVEPAANLGGLRVRKPLQLAVVPDRLADDLVYRPADYPSPTAPLPRAPFVLGMPVSGNGLLMVVTPSAKQTMQLLNAEGQVPFEGVQVACGGASVFVSVLPGGDGWRPLSVKAPGGDQPWQATWSNPFAAQWRLALQGGSESLALMRMVDSPTSDETLEVEEARGLPTPPVGAFIYAYGRSQNTPLARSLPVDILQDALGVGGAARLLGVEGVRTYRHAEEWVAYQDPRAALKILSWMRRRDKPEAQQKADDVCRDIVLSLQGLDARAREYEQFTAQIQRLCRPGAGPAKPFLESVVQQLAELRATLGRTTIPPVGQVADAVAAFRGRPDAPLLPLSLRVTSSLTQRQTQLGAYRRFARSVRNRAGLALARSPESRVVYDQIRELGGQVLRKRYYLEGDWRGEEPLGGPEVSYEQIKDL